MPETELKKCPFCGKYPFIKRHSLGTRGHKFSFAQSIECYCGMAKTKTYALRDTVIHKNERICQFRIIKHQPTIHLIEVETLGNPDRGGIGSTGEI